MFGDTDFYVLFVKFVCVVGVAIILFVFVCWELYHHQPDIVPARKKEKWEIAFENWLREHGNQGMKRL